MEFGALIQQLADDLSRADRGGEHAVGLGLFQEDPESTAVLRRAGSPTTGAARVGPAVLGGQDLLDSQVVPPAVRR